MVITNSIFALTYLALLAPYDMIFEIQLKGDRSLYL